MEANMRTLLLNQIKATYNQPGWYVPVRQAVTGLSDDQSRWQDTGIEHSIAQLVEHIIYWNQRELDKFLSLPASTREITNNETFAQPLAGQWNNLLRQLDKIFMDWETAIISANDEMISASAATIAHINVHTAYHTGQIVYLRKRQGSWNAAQGVA